MINSGRYDQRVSFILSGPDSDGHGGTTGGDPVTVLETFASVKQIKSSRTLEQLQEILEAGYLIYVKYREGFTPTKNMVIDYRGTILTIHQIDLNAERHRREWAIVAIQDDTTDSELT